MRRAEPRPLRAFRQSLPLHLIAACALAASARAQPLFSEYVEGDAYDKALEVWNPSELEVDLAAEGVHVEVYFNGATTPSRRIPLVGLVAPGEVFVLVHEAADPALLALADQRVAGTFFSGDDAVVLRDARGVLDAIGQVGVDPGAEWGDGALGTEGQVLRRAAAAAGDVDPFDAFDVGASWLAAGAADFGDLGAPPGWAPPEPSPGELRIHDIQGRAHASPLVGRTVAWVPGIVTAVKPGGFYLQDPVPDDDPSTSEGIFVYAPGAPAPSVGAGVLVSGQVAEYRPGARATSLSITELVASAVVAFPALESGSTLAPEVLGLEGRGIPTEAIDDDTAGNVELPGETTFDPEQDGIDFYESLEGMWVVVPRARVVGPTNRFGELWVVADDGRGATGRNAAGGLTMRAGDQNPERIKASDALFSGGMPAVDVGVRLGDLDGVISYAFGSYELLPFERPVPSGSGPAVEGTSLVGDRAHVTVATLNVENLDPKVEDRALVASPRSVDDDVGSGRLAELAAHVVEALASPDVLALQEVQDGDGAERTGLTDATATYEALVRAILEAGGPCYAFADVAPLDDADGGEPGGNIRPGFLYRSDRVALRSARGGPGGPADAATVTLGARGPELSFNPGRIGAATPEDAPLFVGTRKNLVAQFDPIGPRGIPRWGRSFFVVNAHFASRAGSSPAYGPTQPPRIRGEDARRAQARAIAGFVTSLLDLAPDARLVVAGDLNAPGFLPPLDVLREARLVDLVAARLPAEERYTYVFEGGAQDLDHILVPTSIVARAEVEIVHAHAEYARAATDHDALVLRLRVAPELRPGRGLVGWLASFFEWLRSIFFR